MPGTRRSVKAWAGVLVLSLPWSSATSAGPPAGPRLPNDPRLGDQWYLFSPDDARGGPGSLGAVEAWTRIRPAPPVVVALLDSGIDEDHPDLEPILWRNDREQPNGRDDDGNGLVDDLRGWDFADGNNRPVDRPSRRFPDQIDHGTALASLMAAVPDNRIGTAGVGRNLRVMNLRIAGTPEVEGRAHAPVETTLPAAMRYAIRHGARVIVFTMTGIAPAERFFDGSLDEAEAAGVLVVVAAGNQGLDIDTSESFGYARNSAWLARHRNVLIVGGTGRDGRLVKGMNVGRRVGIAAPCVDLIVPAWDRSDQSAGPGTSFSTPIVAAVAATLLSQEPGLTPPEVIARLRAASVVSPGMDGVIGGGRLDMRALFPP